MKTKESFYNQSLTVADLTREEVINPAEYNLLCYSRPSDISPDGLPVGKLGNQAGGFPFSALGHEWKGSEFLYLCGRWSLETQGDIQEELASQNNGTVARRFTYQKHYKQRRKDFDIFKHQWMLWVVWQKCIGNEDFRKLLLSMPSDRIICEVEKRDPVWALIQGEDGKLYGCNAMGKILTLCKRALETNTEPEIDYNQLNQSDIYIFGEKVTFRPEEKAPSCKGTRPNFKHILVDLFQGAYPCWQERVGLCIANKNEIQRNARMYNAELPLAYIAYHGRPRFHPTLGQWLDIWNQVHCTKQVCPHCGKTMYLYRVSIACLTHREAEFFCPDCRSVYPVHISGETTRLAETILRFPNHRPLTEVPMPANTEDKVAMARYTNSIPLNFAATVHHLVSDPLPPTHLDDIPEEPIVQPDITIRLK